MSGLHKVLNKIFHKDVWQYFEYASVLNILGLRMVLNKILHNRYLTGF